MHSRVFLALFWAALIVLCIAQLEEEPAKARITLDDDEEETYLRNVQRQGIAVGPVLNVNTRIKRLLAKLPDSHKEIFRACLLYTSPSPRDA